MIYRKSIGTLMYKPLIIIGLALVILGLVLVAIFPGSIYKSAKEIDIKDYKDGDEVIVQGKITDISYVKLFNITQITIDDSLKAYTAGEIHRWQVGDEVYMSIQKNTTLKIGEHEFAVWTTSEDSIHSVNEMRTYFYLASLSGAIVAIIGVILKK